VKHITGIPHSPTGQGIIERAHQTLKGYLAKQKGEQTDAHQRVHKALFTLNYLCLTGDREEPPVVIHHRNIKLGSTSTLPQL
ncbi:IGEB protein, partial [Penelope pileata]|nr:IGEB protein [Penelope pileata]